MTTLDTILYWYTLMFSISTIASAISGGLNLTHLTSLAVFLPIPAYLFLQTLKRYYLWRQLRPSPPQSPPTVNSTFQLKQFITQTNPTYIVTLILLMTAVLISLIKALSLP